MMELTELSLHNYKNHRKLVLKLKPGVTGIIGDNGCGKSNVISAISFLFTGEVDTDTKADSITLGETEGWVRGCFKLNDKDGSLERHLNSSKVALTYDGTTYNKASEVSALWADMLKIDNALFNNVIIAKQGEIQNLFSDETAVREKVFQKIFMVPPTEKLRNTIWEGYIKGCPPEKPAEDVIGLQNSQAATAARRNAILADIDTRLLNLADASLVKWVHERAEFLKRCQQDELKRPGIEAAITDKTNDLNTHLAGNIDLYSSKVSGVDEPGLRKKYDSLLLNKNEFHRQETMKREIDSLLAKVISQDALLALKRESAKLVKECDELRVASIESAARLRETSARIYKFSQLSGKADCPTCNQHLPDILAFLAELKVEEARLKSLCDASNKAASLVNRKLSQVNIEITSAEVMYDRIEFLSKEVDFSAVPIYSEAAFVQAQASLQELEENKKALRQLELRKINQENDIKVLEQKLAGLSSYDGDADLDEELTAMQAALAGDTIDRQAIANAELEAAKLEHELRLYQTRIETSQANGEYNARRKKYVDRLTKAYDLLHVSRFPRKLIETHMDQVQVSLAGYLEHFNLPYSVKVNDGFKIRLVDAERRELPKVSGGQEVMVGICLRLALHKMFAHTFPLLIIDEGTTHLSDVKKPLYFSLIDDLRNQKIIRQIIIIDHDEGLKEVVDQIIQL